MNRQRAAAGRCWALPSAACPGPRDAPAPHHFPGEGCVPCLHSRGAHGRSPVEGPDDPGFGQVGLAVPASAVEVSGLGGHVHGFQRLRQRGEVGVDPFQRILQCTGQRLRGVKDLRPPRCPRPLPGAPADPPAVRGPWARHRPHGSPSSGYAGNRPGDPCSAGQAR